MKAEVPSYIIKYIDCKQSGHAGEKVNLICLNKQCHDHSLICSLCTPKHRGHAYKPIKIYLDELYRRYRSSDNHEGQDIEELQKRKLLLLHNLRSCVERIAEEFMHLQEDIISTYQKIMAQIHDNEARRSRFEEFYLSMIKDNYGDPHFEVRNYLFKEEISILTDQDIFQGIFKAVQREIKNIRSQFISDEDRVLPQQLTKLEQIVQKKQTYLLPKNISFEGESFVQTNAAINAPNLCLFDTDLSQWVSKLRVQIMSFPLGCKLTFGLMRKEDFNKANYVYKDSMNCMYVDSAGKSKLVQHNHIGGMVVNNVIDFFVKKNNFRILCKNNNAIINLSDKSYYFFFAMEGNCKIRILYPYNK